jgi:suppressor for copper-sensitivity B
MFRAMKSLPLLALLLFLPVTTASAAVGEWTTGQKAEVRLLASGIGADGKLVAGVEIKLPDGWTTYWRSPGDAGIAPVFDFTASKNIGATNISYPAPTRQDDGADTVTNVYVKRVVFPVSIDVVDRSKAIDLALTLHLGVCRDICVPEDVAASLTVPPGEKDGTADLEIAAARDEVPGPPEPGKFALDSVARTGGSDRRPVFRFTGDVPDPENAVVFVEGPFDWAPYTPEYVEGPNPSWDIEFSRTGAKTPIAGARFRLTVRSGGRAIDQTLTLN